MSKQKPGRARTPKARDGKKTGGPRSFSIPLDLPLLVASAGPELLFASNGGVDDKLAISYFDADERMNSIGRQTVTLHLDIRTFPPTATLHALDEYAYPAARSRSGRWLIHASPDEKAHWELRHYARGADRKPERVEPVPLSRPDISSMLPHMDEGSRALELNDNFAIERLCFVGEHAVLVPKHVGIGKHRLPLVQGTDGVFAPARDLPPYDKSPADWLDRPAAFGVALEDGSDLFVWNGWCFDWNGRGFERTFEHRLEVLWSTEFLPVPTRDGFFYLSQGRLAQAHRGSKPPTLHFPELMVRWIGPGPRGSVLIEHAEGFMLFEPGDETLVELPPELLGKEPKSLYWNGDDLVFVGSGIYDKDFRVVDVRELDRLPRKPASLVVNSLLPKHRDASTALEGRLSASRPGVAVGAERIFTFSNDQVLTSSIDAPLWRADCAKPIAIASWNHGVAALDGKGAIRLFDTDGTSIGFERTSPSARSLAASGECLAVLAADGVYLVRRLRGVGESKPSIETKKLPFEAALAAAFDGDGQELLLVGQRRRAALVTSGGELREMPDPPQEVHALSFLRDGSFLGLAEQALLRFDARVPGWSFVREIIDPGDHFCVSPDRTKIARSSGAGGVDVTAFPSDAHVSYVSYPDTYQRDLAKPKRKPQPLRVVGLAFLDDDRLVIGLGRGNANIVELGSGKTLRTDPLPGEPRDRWVFTRDAEILIAD